MATTQLNDKDGVLAVVKLPYPPSVNHYWGTDWKNKRKYLKSRGLRYRMDVQVIVWKQFGRPPLIRGRLRVTVGANMPDRKCRDVDNILKAALDALQFAGLYHNDHQVDDLRVVRLRLAPPDGGLTVVIEALDDMPLFSGTEGQDAMQDRLHTFFDPAGVGE